MTENIMTLPTDANPLLVRTQLFLEVGDFASAKEYCDRVLDAEPKNPFAYLAKLMAENNIRDEKQLVSFNGLAEDQNFKFARRFASPELAAKLDALVAENEERYAVFAQLRAACVGRQQTLRQLLAGWLTPEVAAEVQKRLAAEQALMLVPDEAAAAREAAETNALVKKVLICSQLEPAVSILENARSKAATSVMVQELDARIERAKELANRLMNTPSLDLDAVMAEIQAFSKACSKDLEGLNIGLVTYMVLGIVLSFVGFLLLVINASHFNLTSFILLISSVGVFIACAIVCICKISRRDQ